MIEKRIRYPNLTATLFLFPALALYIIFMIYPLIDAIYLSFHSWSGIPTAPVEFVGISNFTSMIQSSRFLRSLKNVGIFILQGLFFQLPLSFILALIVTSKLKGATPFRVIYFLPVILPMTSVGLMWRYLLNPNTGAVNAFLHSVGLSFMAHNWLGNPDIAIFSVVFVSAWVFAGLNMVIFAAGLVAIPRSQYESADIEGAGGLQKLGYITLPQLKETFKIYLILMFTGSFKVFDMIFVMTGGGPNGATDVPATLLYYESFQYSNFGMGNAIGTFILVASLIVSIGINRIFSSQEEIG